MQFYIILLIAVIYMCSKALKFEKISRLEAVTLPFYALLMFLLSVTWDAQNILAMVVLLLLSVGIGWYQAIGAQVKDTDKFDRHGRPVKLLKKGCPYIIGWFLVFLVGIAVEILTGDSLGTHEILSELGDEIERDLFIFKFFSGGHAWYLWETTALSNLAFIYFLEQRFPNLRDTFKKTKSQKLKRGHNK